MIAILSEWLKNMSAGVRRSDLMKGAEVEPHCIRFIDQNY